MFNMVGRSPSLSLIIGKHARGGAGK